MKNFKILGIPGSLRKKSFNKALLKEMRKLSQGEIEIFELAEIPLFNQDLEDKGFPEKVIELKEKIKEAYGVLFVTPEYNHSIPGVLKNAIDWISRGENPLKEKPCAIAGVTTGNFGTIRAQKHLRDVLFSLSAYIYPYSLGVSKAEEKFDENLNLIDEHTRERIKKFLKGFEEFILKLK